MQTRVNRLQDEVLITDEGLDIPAHHIDQKFVVVGVQWRARRFRVPYLQEGHMLCQDQRFCPLFVVIGRFPFDHIDADHPYLRIEQS